MFETPESLGIAACCVAASSFFFLLGMFARSRHQQWIHREGRHQVNGISFGNPSRAEARRLLRSYGRWVTRGYWIDLLGVVVTLPTLFVLGSILYELIVYGESTMALSQWVVGILIASFWAAIFVNLLAMVIGWITRAHVQTALELPGLKDALRQDQKDGLSIAAEAIGKMRRTLTELTVRYAVVAVLLLALPLFANTEAPTQKPTMPRNHLTA